MSNERDYQKELEALEERLLNWRRKATLSVDDSNATTTARNVMELNQLIDAVKAAAEDENHRKGFSGNLTVI